MDPAGELTAEAEQPDTEEQRVNGGERNGKRLIHRAAVSST
jgi:hypothetical protein